MLVNKKFEKVYAKVFYDVTYGGMHNDDEIIEEEIKVENFNGLLALLGEYGINKIREEHPNADVIEVSGIAIGSEQVDDTRMYVQLFKGQSFSGWSTTTINNDDIDNRLLLNLRKVKEIVDNSIEGYPTRY